MQLRSLRCKFVACCKNRGASMFCSGVIMHMCVSYLSVSQLRKCYECFSDLDIIDVFWEALRCMFGIFCWCFIYVSSSESGTRCIGDELSNVTGVMSTAACVHLVSKTEGLTGKYSVARILTGAQVRARAWRFRYVIRAVNYVTDTTGVTNRGLSHTTFAFPSRAHYAE